LEKLSGETLFLDLHNSGITEVIIPRFFNVVGSDQDSGFIFSNTINIFKNNLKILSEFIKSKKPIEDFKLQKFKIYGDGNQERAFIEVDEVADILIALMNFKKNPKKLKNKENLIIGDIINIANINNNIKIKDLVIKFVDIFIKIIESTLEKLNTDSSEYKKLKEILLFLKDNKYDLIEFIPNKNLDKDLVGHLNRNPLVYKLYKVLKKNPNLNINEIIFKNLFNKWGKIMDNFKISLGINLEYNSILINGKIPNSIKDINEISNNITDVNGKFTEKLLQKLFTSLTTLDNNQPIKIVFKIPVLIVLIGYLMKINKETKVKFIILHSDDNFDQFISLIKKDEINLDDELNFPENPEIDKYMDEFDELFNSDEIEKKLKEVSEVFKNFGNLDGLELSFDDLLDINKFEIHKIKNN